MDHLNNHKILIIEDEESLALGLEYNLTEEGYSVTVARDGREGKEYLDNENFDLLILDIMLPFIDGYQLAEYVRKKTEQLPILMLTARTKADDKVRGLELGADDYLTKPFHLQELLLRIKGMLRRKEWYRAVKINLPVYETKAFKIDFANLTCETKNGTIRLTQNEAMFLHYLIEHKGEAVSRKELLENVWHINPDIETRTIDNFVVRIRKHIEADPTNPLFIKSVRGVGYIFCDE